MASPCIHGPDGKRSCLGTRDQGPGTRDQPVIVVSFLIFWVLLFVACYILMEYGQFYLYDEKAPRTALKSLIASAILAAVLTWTRSSFDTMFTSKLGQTVLQAIIWFGVFVLVLQFHPWHALAMGLASMILVTGLATMAVESLTVTSHRARPDAIRHSSKPFRSTMSANPGAVPPPATKEGEASK